MSATTHKLDIRQTLQACGQGPLADPARALFDTLGYRSDKRFDLAPNTAAEFQAQFDPQDRLNAAQALLAESRAVDFLMQVTTDEIGPAVSGQRVYALYGLTAAVPGSWRMGKPKTSEVMVGRFVCVRDAERER